MKSTKTLLALALLATAALASADTLVVKTPYGQTTYTGQITQLDKEDAIGQVEINKATITTTYSDDEIYYDGFEFATVNWIWVGDDTNDKEFGYSGRCSETDKKDASGATDVFLDCDHVENSEGQ